MVDNKKDKKQRTKHAGKDKSTSCSTKDKVCNWFKGTAFYESFKTFGMNNIMSSSLDLIFLTMFYLSTILIVVFIGRNDFSVLQQLQLDPENLLLLSQTTGLIVRVVLLTFLLTILYILFFSATRTSAFSFLLGKKQKVSSYIRYLGISVILLDLFFLLLNTLSSAFLTSYIFPISLIVSLANIAYLVMLLKEKKRFSLFLVSLAVIASIMVIFVFLMSIISRVVVAEYVGYAGLMMILLTVYYLTIYNPVFFTLGRFKDSLKKTNHIAFSRFYKTIPLLLAAVLTHSIIYNIIKKFLSLIYINENQVTFAIISTILLLVFLVGVSWMRYYISIYVRRSLKN